MLWFDEIGKQNCLFVLKIHEHSKETDENVLINVLILGYENDLKVMC